MRLLAVVFAVVVAFIGGFTGPMFSIEHAAAQTLEEKPQYVRVVWHEDPAHRATIVWTTPEKGNDHRLYLDTASHDGDTEAYRHDMEITRSVPDEDGNAWFQHATVEGLHPSTAYYFVVESHGETSEERYFETAPADDRPFKLLYGGDSRSDPEDRRRVNRRIRQLYSSDAAIIGLGHGGDFVATGPSWSQWHQWLSDWTLTTLDDGKILPIIPARGNHEYSDYQGDPDRADNYNAVFGLPGGQVDDYWTTTLGSQVAIVTLDTNTTHGGDQRNWLADQLEQLTEHRKWVLPSYHRPAYPAVKSAGSAKQHWVPLFEQHDLAVALESDGHVLKRTVPIRGGEQSDDGVVYIGEGGMGVGQRTPKDRWYLDEPGMTTAAHHIQLFSFGPDELSYRAIGLDGNTLDEASFEPNREGTPNVIALDEVQAQSPTRIDVDFNKGIASESVDVANFSLEPGVELKAADRHPDYDDVVVLETGETLTPGVRYTVTISQVTDLRGNHLEESLSAEFVPGEIERQAIAFGDVWEYHDSREAPASDWQTEYGDWEEGAGQLGYGDGDEETTLKNETPNIPTVYFRHEFTLQDDYEVVDAHLRVLYDDGFAAWINGHRVLERNVDGGIGFDNYASSGSSDNAMAETDLDVSQENPFESGDNIIAVAVKQRSEGSSDVSFDLGLEATLIPPAPDEPEESDDGGMASSEDAEEEATGVGGDDDAMSAGAPGDDSGPRTVSDDDDGTTIRGEGSLGCRTTGSGGVPPTMAFVLFALAAFGLRRRSKHPPR